MDMFDPYAESVVFYRAALTKLLEAEIPFLVGGAYALEAHTGIVRRTKDFDIFVRPGDAPRALEVLSRAGYKTETSFPHWLGKAFSGDDFLDIIFNSGNGICPVDEQWFEHALRGRVLDLDLQLCPAEETIWQKSFILERDRCDVADVAHLLRHRGPMLDWNRLLQRFGARWRVLLAQLTLYEFIYPGERWVLPQWVMNELLARMKSDARPTAGREPFECHGTMLSATQYLRDIEYEGYRDGRLAPLGNMTPQDVAHWTANFMKPR